MIKKQENENFPDYSRFAVRKTLREENNPGDTCDITVNVGHDSQARQAPRPQVLYASAGDNTRD
jgi:hypothetical protein